MSDEIRPELVAIDSNGKPVPVWFIGPMSVTRFAANHADAMRLQRIYDEALPPTATTNNAATP